MPYLYLDLGAAVLCASFMSFGVKRRWFALAAAINLALSTYVSYVGGQVHYADWLKVKTYNLVSYEQKGIIFVYVLCLRSIYAGQPVHIGPGFLKKKIIIIVVFFCIGF